MPEWPEALDTIQVNAARFLRVLARHKPLVRHDLVLQERRPRPAGHETATGWCLLIGRRPGRALWFVSVR